MFISTKSTQTLKSKIQTEKKVFCSGLYLSARWFVLSQVATKGMNLIVLPNKEAAEYCATDLYNLVEGDNVFFLPFSGQGIERSNYKSSIDVQRTSAINRLIGNADLSFIVSYPEAIEEIIPDINRLKSSSLIMKVGMEISHEELAEKLAKSGFEKVDFVSMPGQYAIRGSIVDIFSYSFNSPYRISFWGDEIEKIHVFDSNTQLSKEEKDEVEISSGDISKAAEIGVRITEILPDSSCVWLDSSDMYSDSEFIKDIEKYTTVYLDLPLSRNILDSVQFKIKPQPVFNKNFELLISDISTRIENGYKVSIFGEKESQLERLRSILSQGDSRIPEFVPKWNIHSGFIDDENKICCYSDHEIFDRFHRASIRRTVEKTEQLTLNDLHAFNIGDYIVHIDHGIGIFGGLVKIRDDYGRLHEVVKITYKDGDVVFVNVHALHKISRFRSKDGEPPKINKLGSKNWFNLKSKAKSRVKDIAKDLIQLYAKRKASKGYAYSADTYLQEELESSFMYEDTPDQELATKAVKRDMEDDCPMDRLVCGDVGFGKTEIAIRAAFKAVADGKQVAVLVPTTILALQHFNTFSARLENMPCCVDYISRLRSAKEIADIKERLADGRIDIIIGTHKILSEAFGFKSLGLLIIDEEQTFGVSAKEKLRQVSAGIDTLTLSATPIPRTLQFSLLGARDLSIINTPPPNRIPIQTEIILWNEKEIRSIIEYELNRGGQLFFLHNRVEELSSIEEILHRLEPEMKICTIHGKLDPKQVEDKMLSFIRGDYDMLLCTTIIENGLDIPNANTIIINQAQRIGLSDLHQLRGRVGRSNRKAFCYLIVPPMTTMTEEARRRLKAIEEFSDLGSGFNIAMQDLDIRGAGNLLGAEQSGFISDMGYETYQKIIAEAMSEIGLETGIMGDIGRARPDCTIETDKLALIPDDYIDITAEKIRIYKQLDSMGSENEIERFAAQIEDRFGKLPAEAVNLFDVVKLRNLGSDLGFDKIIVKNGMFITFTRTEPKQKMVLRGVNSVAQALELLKKLE